MDDAQQQEQGQQGIGGDDDDDDDDNGPEFVYSYTTDELVEHNMAEENDDENGDDSNGQYIDDTDDGNLQLVQIRLPNPDGKETMAWVNLVQEE